MGWKAVKEHYRIEHIVHMRDGDLLIGSPYISDLIVVSPNGALVKGREYRGDELERYQKEITADPALFADLLARADTFANDLTVYTYKGGDIIEKKCEALDWPNITHDGELMYERQFSPDRDQVVKWAKHNALRAVRTLSQSINDAREKLHQLQNWSEEHTADLAKLDEAYPEVFVSLVD